MRNCDRRLDCQAGGAASDPSILFVARRRFARGAFGFALRRLLLFLFAFFIAPGARRPVSFEAISPVIRPECHGTLLIKGVDFEAWSIYALSAISPVLLLTEPGLFLRQLEFGRKALP